MMKPAVAPMVKPAHIDDMRMFEGVPASKRLLMSWQSQWMAAEQ